MFLPTATADAATSEIIATINMPDDSAATFSRMDTTLNSYFTQTYFNTADALAKRLLSDPYRSPFIRGVIGVEPGACTAPDENNLSAVCKSQLVRNLTLRALRRPATEDFAGYLNEVNSAATTNLGLENLVFSVLMSPYFLNRLENDGTKLEGEIHQLSAFGLASRLSFTFWNSMPDESMFRLASTLNMSDEAKVEELIQYVFSKPEKIRDSMDEFYSEWLGLNRLPALTSNGTDKYLHLTQGLTVDDNLKKAMAEEVVELGRYLSLNGGTFKDLFTSDISFARDPNLMKIYGQSIPAPTITNPASAVRFPSGERAGVLTRAATLLTGSDTANPVRRGIHIKRDFLCQTTPAPSAEVLQQIQAITFEPIATTRHRYEVATGQPACMSCHSTINPIGFGLSNYNAFGKFETHEAIFDQAGKSLGVTLQIDPVVKLDAIVGTPLTARNPVEYSRNLANLTSAKACFTEKISSYLSQRALDPAKDACLKAGVYNGIDSEARLDEIFKTIARDKNFRRRIITP